MTGSGSSAEPKGRTEPRLWTRPLRELTPDTSAGFSVIEFARDMLGVDLYPWQRWLLVHALELNEDGTYRFRRVFVIVGRQNGKTTLLSVLTLWWLFVDAHAFPDDVAPRDFLILGTAQNVDLAEEAWDAALKRCDPFPEEDDAELVVPDLAAETRKPVKRNGFKSLRLRTGARYDPRAASRMAGRGKSSARVIMDEMREQQTWDVWGSVSKTKNAVFNSQLWGISSAGDAKSVPLARLREGVIATIDAFAELVETGIQSFAEFGESHDLSSALFEWSAVPGGDLLDPAGILQSNPSCGHKRGFYEAIRSDLMSNEDEAVKRTEILGEWVTARVDVYLDGASWADCRDAPEFDDEGALVSPGSSVAPSSPLVIGVDTSDDRAMSYVAVAGDRDDGLEHVEVIAMRAGMLWVPEFVKRVADAEGTPFVALQSRGCAAAEFAEPLRRLGLTVIEIAGTALGSSAGLMRDRVRDRQIAHRGQPILDLAAGGATTRRLGEVRVWDRSASAVDAAPIVAASNALYGLENLPEVEDQGPSAYETRDALFV